MNSHIANTLAAVLGGAFNGCKRAADGTYTLMAWSGNRKYVAHQIEKAGGRVIKAVADITGFTGRAYVVAKFTMPTVCPACDRGGINMMYDCPDAGTPDHTTACPLCRGRGVYTVSKTCSVCEGAWES